MINQMKFLVLFSMLYPNLTSPMTTNFKWHDLKPDNSTALIAGIGALACAVRMQEKNQDGFQYIRTLSIGGLLSGGMVEIAKNLYQRDMKGSLVGLGMLLGGSLLMSQKDIKTFFGRQCKHGNSLNPSSHLKSFIKADSKFAKIEIEVYRRILEIAEEGQKQEMPFFYRMASFVVHKFKEQDTYLKPLKMYISKQDLVTKVLPYLRTEIDPTKIGEAEGLVTVFGGDPKTTTWMNKNLIAPYLTLASFKLNHGIK